MYLQKHKVVLPGVEDWMVEGVTVLEVGFSVIDVGIVGFSLVVTFSVVSITVVIGCSVIVEVAIDFSVVIEFFLVMVDGISVTAEVPSVSAGTVMDTVVVAD